MCAYLKIRHPIERNLDLLLSILTEDILGYSFQLKLLFTGGQFFPLTYTNIVLVNKSYCFVLSSVASLYLQSVLTCHIYLSRNGNGIADLLISLYQILTIQRLIKWKRIFFKFLRSEEQQMNFVTNSKQKINSSQMACQHLWKISLTDKHNLSIMTQSSKHASGVASMLVELREVKLGL